MFLSLDDLVLWLRVSVFEMWIHLISLTVFTILLALKIDGKLLDDDWLLIFLPLFMADLINAYFNLIVAIRIYFESSLKPAVFRVIMATAYFTCPFLFKYFLFRKLSGVNFENAEVFSFLFGMLQVVAIKACQLG